MGKSGIEVTAALRECKAMLQKRGHACNIDYEKEFSAEGVLSDLSDAFSKEGLLNAKVLMTAVVVHNRVSNIMARISDEIRAPCQLISLDGNMVRIRSVKTDHQGSIGYLHGLMESLKRDARYSIMHYSCSQAALEQIFDLFATDTVKTHSQNKTVKPSTEMNTSLLLDSFKHQHQSIKMEESYDN